MAEDIAVLGLKIVSDDLVKATKRLDKLEKRSKRAEKSTKKLGKSFRGLGAAITAIGLATAFRSILNATIKQEQAVAQLDAAIKSTGASAGFTSKEMQEFAQSMQNVTTFGDEAIISMQSVLLTFTSLKGDVLPATTQAVLDLSARMGQDLQSSALMLGKALNDPIANLGALSRAGIQFSVDQKTLIKSLAETGKLADAQKIILKELETQFGGSAIAARDTFGGALKGLSNAFGDLMEEDGDGMIDAKKATEELTSLLKDPETKQAFSTITSSIISMTAALVEGAKGFANFGKALGWFAAKATGQLNTLQDQVIDLQGEISSLESLRETFVIGSDHWSGATETLTEKYKQLKKIQDEVVLNELSRIEMVQQAPELAVDSGGVPEEVKATFSEKSEGKLDALRTQYGDELVLLEEKFANERVLLDEKLASDITFAEERKLLMNDIDAAEAFERNRIFEEAALERQQTELAVNQAIVGILGQAAASAQGFLKATGKENSAMADIVFATQKALAIAQAVINTEVAFLSAMALGPAGWAIAPMIRTVGYISVGLIAATSLMGGGRGGGGSIPSLGGSTPTNQPGRDLTSPPPETAGIGGTVNITLEGDNFSKQGVRDLIDKIGDEFGDGTRFNIK